MVQKTSARKPLWLVPVLVGVVALIGIVVAYVLMSSPADSGDTSVAGDTGDDSGGVVDVVEPEASGQIDLTHVERRSDEDPLAIGDTDAPVTMVVFSDYQCPYCATWSDETLPEMLDYVEDHQLRIEWRDVNVYGEHSERASKAAYAAALQDTFWEYHDELYADGQIRDPSGLSEDALLELAAELNLDTDQFTEDMYAAETEQQIVENQQLGTDMGAYSTPAFVIGGEPILGAQPTSVFVEAVDEAIASAGQN